MPLKSVTYVRNLAYTNWSLSPLQSSVRISQLAAVLSRKHLGEGLLQGRSWMPAHHDACTDKYVRMNRCACAGIESGHDPTDVMASCRSKAVFADTGADRWREKENSTHRTRRAAAIGNISSISSTRGPLRLPEGI